MECCRADGGEENAITLLRVILAGGISEKALIRKMTREEAREHYGGASAQVYRMFLRTDDAGRFHCRLCSAGANEGGWKRARDVLRHLKRDHLGLGDACVSWYVNVQTATPILCSLLEWLIAAGWHTPKAKRTAIDARSLPKYSVGLRAAGT